MSPEEMLEAMNRMIKETVRKTVKEEIELAVAPINKRLDAIQGEMAEMKQFELDTRTLIESKVMKEISVIAEQHGEIISQLKAVNQRRDASVTLRGSVRTLEDVARNHTQRIEVLEAKAQ